MTQNLNDTLPAHTTHRIERGGGAVHVRDFAGDGAAFVLLHGFPDNAHIYDLLIPHIVAAGRRVVTVDFLGFGASDKPERADYSFAQQLTDVEAVVDALRLDAVVPVGHDAGGPAAINFALRHPDSTRAAVVMNAFYADTPDLRVPELIELFSTPTLASLQRHFLQSPREFAWLVNFQREQLQRGLSAEQRARYESFLQPIIDANFMQQPGAGRAFAVMTSNLRNELSANTARLVDLRRSETPLLLIWGRNDPYLHPGIAAQLEGQSRTAALHVLDAGHWPQIDDPPAVARLMLSK